MPTSGPFATAAPAYGAQPMPPSSQPQFNPFGNATAPTSVPGPTSNFGGIYNQTPFCEF
jgi:hypothetical protein